MIFQLAKVHKIVTWGNGGKWCKGFFWPTNSPFSRIPAGILTFHHTANRRSEPFASQPYIQRPANHHLLFVIVHICQNLTNWGPQTGPICQMRSSFFDPLPHCPRDKLDCLPSGLTLESDQIAPLPPRDETSLPPWLPALNKKENPYCWPSAMQDIPTRVYFP